MVSIERILEIDSPPSVFVSSLQAYALGSRAANHKLLERIANGDLPDPESGIAFLLSEYYHYSHRFTRYLAAVMTNLNSPEHRAALVHNATDEVGRMSPEEEAELRRSGIDPENAREPHPELFRRFLLAIGTRPDDVLRRAPRAATLAWIDAFRDLCLHGGEAQAVGALGIATEGIVSVMYRYLLAGIRMTWPALSSRDRTFFDLHALVDDDHALTLRRIVEALAATPEGRRQLAVGTLRALIARAAFFDDMMHEIDNASITNGEAIASPLAAQGALA